MSSTGQTTRTGGRAADVLIIGNGVVGLSTALELSRLGSRCLVVGDRRPGMASDAAAGLLAPSIGHLGDGARPFFVDSLERYPAFIERLRTFDPTLALVQGLVDTSDEATGVQSQSSSRLSEAEVRVLAPSIVAPHGASFYPSNGAVDNVALMRALRLALEAGPAVELVEDDPAVSLDLSSREVTVTLRSGERRVAGVAVLAAGAWSPQIQGLPRPLPVAPLKGQMLAVASTPLTHAVMGPDVYLVPRLAELVIGATVEHAGFDTSVEPMAIEGLRQAAIRILPSVANAPVLRSWAGIRPATPDLLPIIGPDPAEPRLIYACGHSKNGILLAPGTAVAVAALARGERLDQDIAAFSINRFVN